MKTEAETRGLQPQATEAWSPLEPEEAGKDPPQEPSEGAGVYRPLDLGLCALDCEKTHFCGFKLVVFCYRSPRT